LDTKSKKSKPFLVWLCFFMGVNLVVSLAILGIVMSSSIYNNISTITAALKSDIKETMRFKQDTANRFDTLARDVTSENGTADSSEGQEDTWKHEGENLLYRAENQRTGRVLSNSKTGIEVSENGLPKLPKGYDYFLYYNEKEFMAVKDEKPFDVLRMDSGYWDTSLWMYMNGDMPRSIPDMTGVRIFLAVKKEIVKNPYAYSALYEIKREADMIKWVVIGFAALFIFGLVLLFISIIRREAKREFDRKLAWVSGRLWLEIKVGISFLLLFFFLMVMRSGGWRQGPVGLLASALVVATNGWWAYCILVDLLIHKGSFFSNNSINALIRAYHSYERRKPFQKAMLLRVYVLIAAETVLVMLTGIFWTAAFIGDTAIYFLPMLLFISIGTYLMYRYLRRFSNTVNDTGEVVDRIEAIKTGDMAIKHSMNPGADLYFAEESLNRIQEGISRAAEEKIKSERTKIDLITNVSHDLKTPLTSIISYVDLLSKEEGLPEHVSDYVKILSQKSDRLKTLIQDIFDLSKAAGGDIKVERERLDLGKLIRQTLADLDEQVIQSELMFKVTTPDEPVFIASDGNKLYRVFLNLISNTLKYSLAGSRVYVDLAVAGSEAAVVIKNTANYEMNFKEDEILERFVRGDKARSTEGSGLGLAIAQSFVQACGGSFDLKVDGDLFKVKVGFSLEK
jgi:signal transduction histidine kinase